MLLKVIAAILIIAIVISLGCGLYFLIAEKRDSTQIGRLSRLTTSLYTRVILAVLLIVVLIYGAMTGQLKSNAPWDAYKDAPHSHP